ncbi:MAG: fluoride efflux transporter CrcB [Bacteroidaceae bacterium]|nr:fluoride efflux transporter CrcB [Bacteroidaceae bacterium]
MLKELLLVGTGSFIGGATRYLVSSFVSSLGSGFPWGTFIINFIGCLLIGFLWGLTSRFPNFPPQLSLLLSVGFCGGFTTFSTFAKENLLLLQTDNYTSFSLYVFGSVAIGVFAVMLGFTLTK